MKLKFYFHNPNTKEDTTSYILKVLVEANKGKIEKKLKEVYLEKLTEEITQ